MGIPLSLLPLALPWWIGLLRRPLLHLLPLRGFPSAAGFSLTVAAQAGFARWPSIGTTCRLQLATWSGCRAKGHSISWPSMAWIADFLLWLHRSEGFCLSSIRGYRLMLSAVFHFRLPVISFHPVLRALFRSFRVSFPRRAVHPPSWALAVFFRHLPSSSFASLHSSPLRSFV